MDNFTLIPSLLAKLRDKGGFSVGKDGTPLPVNGYISSIPGHGTIIDGFPTTAELVAYWDRHFGQLEANQYLGAWLNEGRTHLDLNLWHANRNRAFRYAKIGNQLAVYQIANATSIPVDQYGNGEIWPWRIETVEDTNRGDGKVFAINEDTGQKLAFPYSAGNRRHADAKACEAARSLTSC